MRQLAIQQAIKRLEASREFHFHSGQLTVLLGTRLARQMPANDFFHKPSSGPRVPVWRRTTLLDTLRAKLNPNLVGGL